MELISAFVVHNWDKLVHFGMSEFGLVVFLTIKRRVLMAFLCVLLFGTISANNQDNFVRMKKTILVVEDEPGFRKVLQHALSRDYNITAVENGQQAIDSLKVLSADLVITDVNMPQVNGFELITFLKSNPVFKQIPVVVISSFDEAVVMQQVKRTELVGYFQKPMDIKSLKSLVDLLLSQSVLA